MNAAKALSAWLGASPQMNAAGVVVESFTDVDVHVLNRHLRWWYETRDVPKSQDGKGGYTGGTNTQSRNLRALFVYLAEEYGHPNPYADPKRHNWAAPQLGKPKTLSAEFVRDVLTLTAWGHDPERREFETVRDHALLRVLTEGLRAEEILNLQVQDLDLPSATLLVVPLKGQRNSTDARPIPLQPSTVKALTRYLRVRTTHPRAESGHPDSVWLWLGTRGRARLAYKGLYWIVKRRAEQAGYDPDEVTPHSFCHTWAHDLLDAGVSGENVMAIRGWSSPAMLRRYGADQASQRAINAVHQLGDRYS
ncbi:site-specific integrase [Streptomyces sp. NPDC053782]|uniref:tyrosine-type recombinase/integrase n=1 Tax=Streptomyces sp. NPDC053782 TaxID=3155535 RepID=UPI00342B968C